MEKDLKSKNPDIAIIKFVDYYVEKTTASNIKCWLVAINKTIN